MKKGQDERYKPLRGNYHHHKVLWESNYTGPKFRWFKEYREAFNAKRQRFFRAFKPKLKAAMTPRLSWFKSTRFLLTVFVVALLISSYTSSPEFIAEHYVKGDHQRVLVEMHNRSQHSVFPPKFEAYLLDIKPDSGDPIGERYMKLQLIRPLGEYTDKEYQAGRIGLFTYREIKNFVFVPLNQYTKVRSPLLKGTKYDRPLNE